MRNIEHDILHDTLDLSFRSPLGACLPVSSLNLAIRANHIDGLGVATVFLHYVYGLKSFNRGCQRMTAEVNCGSTGEESCQDKVFFLSMTLPAEAGLFFYWFEVKTIDDHSHFYTRTVNNSSVGDIVYDEPHFMATDEVKVLPFQVTIYKKDYVLPDWFKGAVMYQIFPDRFARAKNFSALEFQNIKKRNDYIYHEDWREDVDIDGKEATGYIACDFFGGSLKGIQERLTYLADLGVNVLYLNPIFAARSNHRYDTADYFKIDPLLGSIDDFTDLCKAAAKFGIRIILDAVLSHTGADSIYFNKYNNFPTKGAYQEVIGEGVSPYRGWFDFYYEKDELKYNSWWGFPELPTINKSDLSYQDFICGPDGVLAFWLKLGASGFRLDVSDELPDYFLRRIYESVKKYKEDAIILGEVWEDASNKISYGSYRDFVFGRTHDSFMGYPFNNSVIDFFSKKINLADFTRQLALIQQNYPPDVCACNMNLLGSHDLPRAINRLAAIPQPETRVEQRQVLLNDEQLQIGTTRLKQAFIFTFLYIGNPSIYYGDEKLMSGCADPFNRRPFDWTADGIGVLIQKLAKLRTELPILKTGFVKFIRLNEEILVMERYLQDGLDIFGNRVAGCQKIFLLMNITDETAVVPSELLAQFNKKLKKNKIIPPQTSWICYNDKIDCLN